MCLYICTLTVIFLKCYTVINTTMKTTNALGRTSWIISVAHFPKYLLS